MAKDSRSPDERRRHERFRTTDVSGVLSQRRLANVLDMSEGGVSFSYIDNGGFDSQPVELGIVFGSGGEYLEKLPFRTVSDVVFSEEDSAHPVVIRRRSIEFVGLNEKQRHRLVSFIKRHARWRI